MWDARPDTAAQRLELDMDDSASRRVAVTDEQGDTNTNNGVKSLVRGELETR